MTGLDWTGSNFIWTGLVQISSYFQTINTLNSEINFQDVREKICEQLEGNLNQNVQ